MSPVQDTGTDHRSDALAPREHLHARVSEHVHLLVELDLPPNRAVTLGGTVIHGWLLDDPFAQASSRRWLLLADGDVWCEAAYLAGPWRHDQGMAYGWLTQATPALEAVLNLSLDEARGGGGGLLASAGPAAATYRVADRRDAIKRRLSTDRRRRRAAPTGAERRGDDRRGDPDRRRHA